MNNNGNVSITLMQFIFLIHGVQMGVGVLTLPRELAQIAGTDGWITIIISWILCTAASLIIIQVMKNYPDGTIIDLLSHYFGKWIGKIATLIFAFYFALLTMVIFIREALFIQVWILPFTKIYVLAFLLAVPSYMLVRNNINILGRYSQLVFFMTIWLTFIILMPLKYANWLHLLPVLKEGWIPVLKAIKSGIYSFVGFETAFFLYPYLRNKEKASFGVIIANTLSLAAFLFITIVAYVYFSPDEISKYSEPAVTMLKVIDLNFIERLEIIFFTFYIFVISTSVLPAMFFTVYCTSRLTGSSDHRKHAIVFLSLIWLYTFIVPTTFERNRFMQGIVEQGGSFISFLFPLCLWLYFLIRKLVKGRTGK